ncbi:MAG TPA: ABC transporter substrate-binding protein [Cyanobacteria bacterium UBA11149]|nr:ABC transporter substrate-binding protein [Cyanobacteria bacterium UBA11367]HBE56487.1 ABC transporter substrate-binding protein [Cyanobacteria bacterium UBA11366]HBK64954.1 ABC transporter substrate-binding protein [Cyanobacteria bacterium UBA11166]HBR76970.1 ABC transporter substrate-binding protein [Cyanobacteria bacterium UBA11159]HBS71971.1 ABC transporter substrate-binding protein [Cyanobacteria bacterium UBA11153]HBW91064.1 ABC transporter substrate-binding protein [Cyanobacteria bac
MNWWQKLRKNYLASFGAIVLLIFYLIAIGADFVAPYNPYDSQKDGSLLPPTQIYWQNGESIGPYVYPTTQGPTDLETGDRKLYVDKTKPSPIRFFVKGSTYNLFQLRLPIGAKFEEVEVFGGIPCNLHLFGAVGEGKINLLGTDEQGRDQLSRLIHGSRISLSIGLVGVAISFPIGILIGGISGYFGGWLDAVIMRLVEVLMTIPSIYLLVALAAVLPPGLTSAQRFLLIVVITSFIGWAGLARVIRGQVLSIKEREFVQASQAMGGKSLYIIVRHVLPQTTTYTIISATLSVPSFIGAESVLSLIGLGIQQPDPSWGNLLSLATNASILVLQPWLIWPPAALIVLTVLAFNLLGDGLRDALDPRSLQR